VDDWSRYRTSDVSVLPSHLLLDFEKLCPSNLVTFAVSRIMRGLNRAAPKSF
jgi:hypothetical protein